MRLQFLLWRSFPRLMFWWYFSRYDPTPWLFKHPVVRAFSMLLVGGYVLIFADNFADTYSYQTQINPPTNYAKCVTTPGYLNTRGRLDWSGAYLVEIDCP